MPELSPIEHFRQEVPAKLESLGGMSPQGLHTPLRAPTPRPQQSPQLLPQRSPYRPGSYLSEEAGDSVSKVRKAQAKAWRVRNRAICVERKLIEDFVCRR